MNVEAASLKVDYWEARKKYHEYRAAVKSGRGTADDETLRGAFRVIANGGKVIDVPLAIANAGLTSAALPKLAIARADWKFVFAWVYDGRFVFSHKARGWTYRGDLQMATHNVNVRIPIPATNQSPAGRAQVPSIPPAHRPQGLLNGYRILFEAEWTAIPPTDPILLKHIGGPFYGVLAEWDLTDVERAVLRAKL